jgi:hypothetical protein
MPGARPGLTARVQSCHTGFSFYTFSQEAFLTGLDWLCGDIYCTITTKGSLFLEFSLTEMADKFSFELWRFLSTSKKAGCHRHLNLWS